MKPWIHSKSSARKYGGVPDDYISIHDLIDLSKAAHPDMRHRTLFHNSLGPYIAEQVYGHNIINSDGKEVSVRDIVENHIIEDLGFIPSLTDWLKHMTIPWWAGGQRGKSRKHDIVD